jgi:CheY-like chemotaxis protein
MEVPVLVVDGATEGRRALREALSAEGIDTVEARDGAEALARAGEEARTSR